jgi:hypothetical protein
MPFAYLEVMPPRYLKYLPDSLNLSKSVFVEAKLIRLLLGTIDFNAALEGINISQRKNYSNARGIENNTLSAKIIRDSFAPLTIEDLDSYLRKFKNTNYNLHSDILIEISLYFVYKEKGNHVSCFLHLYRILEYVSYSFPLIHSSLSRGYIGTFKALQSYFTKDGSELEFIDNFIKKLFDGDPIFGSSIDIDIVGPNAIVQDKIYKSFKTILSGFLTCDDATKRITISFSNIIKATIHLRNRYFHFAIGGQKNIRSTDIQYPDLFFQQINECILNWISIVYFEVLQTSISNWKS